MIKTKITMQNTIKKSTMLKFNKQTNCYIVNGNPKHYFIRLHFYYKNSKDYCMPQEFKNWAIIDGYTYYEVLEN